jgi:hypothetical protein
MNIEDQKNQTSISSRQYSAFNNPTSTLNAAICNQRSAISSACIRGQNQHAIVVDERGPWIADKPLTVEVRGDGGVQPMIPGDERGKTRELRCQRGQQLTERRRPHFDFGDADARTRKAEKLNVHGLKLLVPILKMIAWAFNQPVNAA